MNLDIDKRYERMLFFDKAACCYDVLDKSKNPIRLVDDFLYKA